MPRDIQKGMKKRIGNEFVPRIVLAEAEQILPKNKCNNETSISWRQSYRTSDKIRGSSPANKRHKHFRAVEFISEVNDSVYL